MLFENYGKVNHLQAMLENNGRTVELKLLGGGAKSGHMRMPRKGRQYGRGGAPSAVEYSIIVIWITDLHFQPLTLSRGLLKGTFKMLLLLFYWHKRDSMVSEHTINRARFPLEMHLVHTSVRSYEYDGWACCHRVFVPGKVEQNIEIGQRYNFRSAPATTRKWMQLSNRLVR